MKKLFGVALLLTVLCVTACNSPTSTNDSEECDVNPASCAEPISEPVDSGEM